MSREETQHIDEQHAALQDRISKLEGALEKAYVEKKEVAKAALDIKKEYEKNATKMIQRLIDNSDAVVVRLERAMEHIGMLERKCRALQEATPEGAGFAAMEGPEGKTDGSSWDSYPKIASLATYPGRAEVFPIMFSTIAHQFDHIYVYLNEYDHVPDFLKGKNVTVFAGKEYENLSANGKVFFLNHEKRPGYYFTLDDDILYPPNYAEEVARTIRKYKGRVAVSVHGSRLADPIQWYYERFAIFPFESELQSDVFISLPGSGTFAYHSDYLKTEFEDFMPKVMVDLTYGILAKRQGVPIISIKRPRFWLYALDRVGMFETFRNTRTHHTDQAILNAPWDFRTYSDFVMPVLHDVFGDLDEKVAERLELDRDFIMAALKGKSLRSWGKNALYYKKVQNRERLKESIGELSNVPVESS